MRLLFTQEGSHALDAGLLNLIERVERICSRYRQLRIKRKFKKCATIQEPRDGDGRNTEPSVKS